MRKRIRRYLLVLSGIGVAGAATFFLLFMRPLPVEVARAAENVPIKIFGLGTVEARILSKIGFEASATLVELHADFGDRVKRGDVLARLHSAEQEAGVARAAAEIVKAKAAVNMAMAAVKKARSILAQKKRTNKRKQALLPKRTVSVEAAEDAQMVEDVAADELGVAIGDVDVARAVLENTKAQYAYEKVLLDNRILRAPYDAIVVARHKELGAVMTVGEPLFTLVAPETVWVLAYVDESRAGRLRLGQPAEIRLRSLPRRMYQGHVARIDIESDRVTEERRVYVACDQCRENFHLGEQAEIFVTTIVLDEALLVPETAVEGFDGIQGTVWTVENGKLHRRKVAFGRRTLDARLEIVDGLPRRARVLTNLPAGLREGRAAQVPAKASP